MKDFQIRACTDDDCKYVFELLKQLWPDIQLDYETIYPVFCKAIKSDNQKLIVGLSNNKVVGFCTLTIKNSLWQGGNLGYIDELIVDENHRGLGIGHKLIDEITTIAKNNHCKIIELDSAFHRKEAHLFYENLKYESRAYLFSKRIN
ncbi:MAG: GNAT family N-acetyltransferase [Bacteroidales bacterium]|jgi:ribosomal protein S18 acetylase RimI-like enzyme|nr:GNAT family N-acetyltransferase [Bacteroidales bacterium]